MNTQANLISEIRRMCREFEDKLPENKSELKVLPVYAENIIRRFDGNVTTKREIENQSMIWDGIFEIYLKEIQDWRRNHCTWRSTQYHGILVLEVSHGTHPSDKQS